MKIHADMSVTLSAMEAHAVARLLGNHTDECCEEHGLTAVEADLCSEVYEGMHDGGVGGASPDVGYMQKLESRQQYA